MAEENKENTYTEKQVVEMIQRALKKQAEADAAKRKDEAHTTVVQVAEDKYVTLMFIGCIASGTSVALSDLGKITRPATAIDVAKKDFIKSLGVPVVEALLRDRQIVVTDGLSDEERKRFGLDYKKGEILSAADYFDITRKPVDELCALFTTLCKAHKQTVIDILMTAYFEKHDENVTLAKVKKLNKVSKTCGYPDGAFTPILTSMANEMISDED